MARRDSVDTGRGPNVVLPAVLLGVGLGGFFDGIVLHQVLQWHHVLSLHTPPSSVPNLQINTLADGLFHLFAWVCTLTGVVLLWGVGRAGAAPEWPRLAGGMLAGWGGFNLAEGVIDHHVLQIHHVRPGAQELWYDVGFLVWGGVMLVAGLLLLRSDRRKARPAES